MCYHMLFSCCLTSRTVLQPFSKPCSGERGQTRTRRPQSHRILPFCAPRCPRIDPLSSNTNMSCLRGWSWTPLPTQHWAGYPRSGCGLGSHCLCLYSHRCCLGNVSTVTCDSRQDSVTTSRINNKYMQTQSIALPLLCSCAWTKNASATVLTDFTLNAIK